MGVWSGCEWLWNLRWRRRLYERERIELDRLHLIIDQIKPQQECRDIISWHGSKERSFPIKEIVGKLYESADPIIPKSLANFIWSIKAPPRALIMIWLDNMEKLKTSDFLVKKGLIDPNDAYCTFCNTELESNSHILFTCQFSWYIWMQILNWWGISGVLQNKCGPFTDAWRHLAPKRKRGKLWNLTLACVMWSIWFERNKIKFEAGSPNVEKLIFNIKIRIGEWAKELLGLDPPNKNTLSQSFDVG